MHYKYASGYLALSFSMRNLLKGDAGTDVKRLIILLTYPMRAGNVSCTTAQEKKKKNTQMWNDKNKNNND